MSRDILELLTALDAAEGELAKCGRENCMGQRLDGPQNWVTEERLHEVQAALARVTAERDALQEMWDNHDAPHNELLAERDALQAEKTQHHDDHHACVQECVREIEAGFDKTLEESLNERDALKARIAELESRLAQAERQIEAIGDEWDAERLRFQAQRARAEQAEARGAALEKALQPEAIEQHIRSLPFHGPDADRHRTLVAGNLRNLAGRLRTALAAGARGGGETGGPGGPGTA